MWQTIVAYTMSVVLYGRESYMNMRGPQISHISRIHLQNLGAKMATWSQFHGEEPQFWSDALTCSSVRVHGYIYTYVYYIYCAVLKRLTTPSDFRIPLPSIVPFAHS